MASRLETLSEDEILAINEAALPSSTKKQGNFACSCELVIEIFFLPNL